MSQTEVLKSLVELNGKATDTELIHVYNKYRFPYNKDFSIIPLQKLKNSLRIDCERLTNSKMITRTIISYDITKKARDPETNKPVIIYIYELTDYGKQVIQQWKKRNVYIINNNDDDDDKKEEEIYNNNRIN
jgi:hypothetical protein